MLKSSIIANHDLSGAKILTNHDSFNFESTGFLRLAFLDNKIPSSLFMRMC